MTIKKQTLDGRLSAAAAYVRPGAVFADIGTDHAYLPIALLQSGIIRRGLAADIAEGPLSRAREHIAACGCSDKIDTLLTDGLTGVERYTPTDIAVCGMGGELIARILSDAPFTRDPALRLILQPMTMQPHLRLWLAENGYSIDDETIACAGGKRYPVLCCHYTGVPETCSPLEALLGKRNIEKGFAAPDAEAFLLDRIARQRVITEGKQRSGDPAAEDAALLAAMEALLPQRETDPLNNC